MLYLGNRDSEGKHFVKTMEKGITGVKVSTQDLDPSPCLQTCHDLWRVAESSLIALCSLPLLP